MNVSLQWAIVACVASAFIMANGFCAVTSRGSLSRWVNTLAVVNHVTVLAWSLAHVA